MHQFPDSTVDTCKKVALNMEFGTNEAFMLFIKLNLGHFENSHLSLIC